MRADQIMWSYTWRVGEPRRGNSVLKKKNKVGRLILSISRFTTELPYSKQYGT